MQRMLRLTLLISALLAACSPGLPAITPESRVLTVMTHDSFEVSEQVVEMFEREYQASVEFIKSGDAGTALNQAILSRSNPIADVLYGVDNTFLGRALTEGIFLPYASTMLPGIPDEFKLDPESRALPIDYGDVCMNFDRALFEARELDPPADLAALTDPAYTGMLVTENPATSSPGLAFMLATIAQFGDPGYLDYWRELRANDVLVVNDWETAYYGEFSLHGGGRPIVVSYGSSPPAEVYFAEAPPEVPPSGVITAGQSCFRQIEFAGVLAGTDDEALARAWIDFMLSKLFQEDMPLNMFVFPVNPEAGLPQVFAQHLVVPDLTATVPPADIQANRDDWIRAWTEVVLR